MLKPGKLYEKLILIRRNQVDPVVPSRELAEFNQVLERVNGVERELYRNGLLRPVSPAAEDEVAQE